MLCDLCHKNIATVHITEIVNGKIMELHICQECAHLKTDELKHQLSVTEFLGSLTTRESSKDDTGSLRCPFCGISFNDFKKKGLLGCGHCYVTFKRQLRPIVEKIHRTIEYKGKAPLTASENIILDRELTALKRRLKRAVQIEAYEEAANIRDKIRELEKKMSSK